MDDAATNAERLAVGTALLRRIGGEDYDRGIEGLRGLSPDVADLTIAFPYGDVLSRTGLDLVLRQQCTVAILLSNGSAQAQLKFHMAGLLNVGGSVDDIVELLVIAGALLGFSTAIDGIAVLREVVREREITYKPHRDPTTIDRAQRGRAALARLLATDPDGYTSTFSDVAPALADWTVAFEFSDVFARETLAPAAKHLAAIMMLAARGNRDTLLSKHITGALATGLERGQLIEALIQLAAYAGFPTALNAFTVAADAVHAAPVRTPGSIAEEVAADRDRRAIGLATMAATSGGSGDAVVQGFDDLAPDIGAMIIEHGYCDVFSRVGLDPKIRELTAIAALAAVMSAVSEGPLGVHIAAALTLGVGREEIVETILNVAPYFGQPTAQRAIAVAAKHLR